MRLVVFGASGPTGLLLTDQALASGAEVVAVTRQPTAFPRQHQRLTIVGADVLDAAAVDAAVAGGDAVVSALGVPYSRQPITTYSHGTARVVAAMRRRGVRRIAVVSSSAVDPVRYSDAGPFYNRVLQPFMARVVGKTLYDDMRRMEALLRRSGVAWTVVRPGGLYELPNVTDYAMAEGHASGRFTARADLAASLLRLVEDERFVSKVVSVTTTEQNPSVLELIRTEALAKGRPRRELRRLRSASNRA